MAAAGAAEMILRCVFEGSLKLHDVEIERRPYHKNCSCALHNLKGAVCSSACAKQNNLSFAKKKLWGSCSLSMAAASKNNFSSSQDSLIYSDSTCHSEQRRLETEKIV